MQQFRDFVQSRHDMAFADYPQLHTWSVQHRTDFWSDFWDFSGIHASCKGTEILRYPHAMPGAQFFPEAKLNFAQNLLRFCQPEAFSLGDAMGELAKPALVFQSETHAPQVLSRQQLFAQVASCAAALRAAKVGSGDRVAGYLANCPEAIIAMLATASLGAVWSSASPDFGVQGVVDRFGQIQPKVLFAVDGYWYNGKAVFCQQKTAEIVARLPSVQQTVIVPLLGDSTISSAANPEIPTMSLWNDFLQSGDILAPLEFAQVDFSHPLFVMFSSGTTGVPKCIVHGHGGTLLQILKEQQLHCDVLPGDRLFYFTTLGWMMWNWLTCGLAAGATLLLYDGSPFAKTAEGQMALFDFLNDAQVTHFGTSAKFIETARKESLVPKDTHPFASLRSVMSTGSPLAPESFDYIATQLKPGVKIASISGGTDIVSCFLLGHPDLPVHRGELQCAGLGMDVQVYDEEGHVLSGNPSGKGELVCASPFPSMPVGFWNDPQGEKYRAAYFSRFKNVWCHGDFLERTANGGYIIHGRSDAVLNPGGVRIGTAEIYRQVEKIPQVTESIAIGQDWQGDVRVVLFVKLREGLSLDTELITSIKKTIREQCSPRHVPAKILQVKDIPRTKSGKLTELAVRQIVHGEKVKNIESLANPEALNEFRNRTELLGD